MDVAVTGPYLARHVSAGTEDNLCELGFFAVNSVRQTVASLTAWPVFPTMASLGSMVPAIIVGYFAYDNH